MAATTLYGNIGNNISANRGNMNMQLAFQSFSPKEGNPSSAFTSRNGGDNEQHMVMPADQNGCINEPEQASEQDKARPHQCPQCDKSFIAKHHLKNHMMSKHSPGGVKLFGCSICSQRFGQRSSLTRHLSKVHQNPTTFGKQQPSQQTVAAGAAGANQQQHEQQTTYTGGARSTDLVSVTANVSGSQPQTNFQLPSKEKVARLTCSVCLRVLSSGDSLRRHMRVHYKDTRLPCQMCERSYASAYSLRMHISSYHQNIRSHPCDQCDKQFYNATHLSNHKMAIHSDEKNFICGMCNQAFKLKKMLRKHEAGHTKVVHSCVICNQVFNDRQTLLYHMVQVHTLTISGPGTMPTPEQQPMQPPQIQHQQQQQHHQSGHIHPPPRHNQHPRRKPRMCQKCGINFTRADSLRRHMENKHGQARHGSSGIVTPAVDLM